MGTTTICDLWKSYRRLTIARTSPDRTALAGQRCADFHLCMTKTRVPIPSSFRRVAAGPRSQAGIQPTWCRLHVGNRRGAQGQHQTEAAQVRLVGVARANLLTRHSACVLLSNVALASARSVFFSPRRATCRRALAYCCTACCGDHFVPQWHILDWCAPARSLFDNEIGDTGASALGEALKVNTTLAELSCVRHALRCSFAA